MTDILSPKVRKPGRHPLPPLPVVPRHPIDEVAQINNNYETTDMSCNKNYLMTSEKLP